MDITDIVSTDYVEFDAETPVSKARGAFEDPALKGIVVTADGEYRGVVTRRQLTTSHTQPSAKLRSLVWYVPRVDQHEDVRTVARLMLDSESRVLPVFEGEQMVGVVTADALLVAVRESLDAATVDQAMSGGLVTVTPETPIGKALSVFRDERITHLPVVEGGEPAGMVSLADLTDIVLRDTTRSQGGDADPAATSGSGQPHGGFGAREGEIERILDLPVRDTMTTPVRTIVGAETLDIAVAEMFEHGVSSLVVVDPDGAPTGILTKSDVLESLTWEAGGNRAVQVYGIDLLDDVPYEDIVEMVDWFESIDSEMRVLDAKLHLHKHDETLRGTPLLLARLRLSTDRGLFLGTGEGYGAEHAIAEASDVIERKIRDEKTYGKTKKHPDIEFWEKRFGWTLDA